MRAGRTRRCPASSRMRDARAISAYAGVEHKMEFIGSARSLELNDARGGTAMSCSAPRTEVELRDGVVPPRGGNLRHLLMLPGGVDSACASRSPIETPPARRCGSSREAFSLLPIRSAGGRRALSPSGGPFQPDRSGPCGHSPRPTCARLTPGSRLSKRRGYVNSYRGGGLGEHRPRPMTPISRRRQRPAGRPNTVHLRHRVATSHIVGP